MLLGLVQAAGLVNGAIGTLQNVIYDPHSGQPARMQVLLDGHVTPIMIDKVTVYFAVNPKKRLAGERGFGMYRHQFPLQLAYGVTVSVVILCDCIMMDCNVL